MNPGHVFFKFGPFPAFLVLFVVIFLIHIATRNIDMRMRNNNSDFIQDGKQHSLHPYHLICMAAENILFTINPTTLSTNTAQNHSFTSLPPYTVVENSLSSKIAQKKLGRCGVRSCDLQITCSLVPNGMILDAVFLYSGLLSCP